MIAALGAALLLTACNGISNALSGATGGSGMARLIDASPTTTQTDISLLADKGTIDSGLSESERIGPYAKVTAGTITFDINTGNGSSDLVPAIHVDVAASTNYTIALQGEPGGADYQAFGFTDANAQNVTTTVRFKVNNAAPNLATPVDVYVWQRSQHIPAAPTVAGLALDQDSGSTTNAPGDPYIPVMGSATIMPTGTYDIAIVLTGGAPNGTTDLFDGSVNLDVNNSYSLTIEDMNATQNDIGVIASIDEPFQTSNQASVTRHSVAITRGG
jgi:uncharacterized protein DUF4397